MDKQKLDQIRARFLSRNSDGRIRATCYDVKHPPPNPTHRENFRAHAEGDIESLLEYVDELHRTCNELYQSAETWRRVVGELTEELGLI